MSQRAPQHSQRTGGQQKRDHVLESHDAKVKQMATTCGTLLVNHIEQIQQKTACDTNRFSALSFRARLFRPKPHLYEHGAQQVIKELEPCSRVRSSSFGWVYRRSCRHQTRQEPRNCVACVMLRAFMEAQDNFMQLPLCFAVFTGSHIQLLTSAILQEGQQSRSGGSNGPT